MIISLVMPVAPAGWLARHCDLDRLLAAPEQGGETDEQRDEARRDLGEREWHFDPAPN
jgi:hypothetical protein